MTGIKRGCVAVDSQSLYSGLVTSSHPGDVTGVVGFYRPESEITKHTATIDLCDTNDCNIGLSRAGKS